MEIKKFLHAVNLRQLNESLNAPNVMKGLTWSHFIRPHRVGYGRNGVSQMIHFIESKMDLESVRLERGFGPDSTYLHFYAKTRVRPAQCGSGEDVEDGYRVTFRNSKGKLDTCSVYPGGSNDRAHELLKVLNPYIEKTVAEEAASEKSEDDPQIIKLHTDEQEADNLRERRQELVKHLMWRVCRDTDSDNGLKAFNEAYGVEVTEVFHYNFHLAIHVKFATVKRGRIELGYRTNGTYNSLPGTLTLQFKTVKDTWRAPALFEVKSLSDMGVEFPGYYSHSDRETIDPAQAAQVSKFARAFKRKAGESKF